MELNPIVIREEQLQKREKKPLNWIVKELFDLAQAQGLSLKDLSEKVEQKFGKRIPDGSLKYWRQGYSDPKISEVDLIAQVLGYELDLMPKV